MKLSLVSAFAAIASLTTAAPQPDYGGYDGSYRYGGQSSSNSLSRYGACPFRLHIYSSVTGAGIVPLTQYLSDVGGPVGMDLPDSTHQSTLWYLDNQGRIQEYGTGSYLQQIVNRVPQSFPGALGIISQPIQSNSNSYRTLKCWKQRSNGKHWIVCDGGQGQTWQSCAQSGWANSRPTNNPGSFFYLSHGLRRGYNCKQYWLVAEPVTGVANFGPCDPSK